MWFMPTRNRPDMCVDSIASMRAVNDVPEIAVMIDDDPGKYANVPWPAHWHIHTSGGHIELTAAMGRLHALYPDQSFYGMITDHYRPLTPWSSALQDAAGDWFQVWPEDNYVSYYQVSSAPCWGGKLAKAMGFLFLPGTVHLGTEHPWITMWRQLGNGLLLKDVVCTHDMLEVSGRPGDANRNRMLNGHPYTQDDTERVNQWMVNESAAWLASIKSAMEADGIEFLDGKLHPKYGRTPCP